MKFGEIKMPCTQTGSLDGDRILSLENSLDRSENIVTKQAQLLCEATKIIVDNDLLDECNKELKAWYAHHVVIDNQRKGLEKLTDDEIRALGLDSIAADFDWGEE